MAAYEPGGVGGKGLVLEPVEKLDQLTSRRELIEVVTNSGPDGEPLQIPTGVFAKVSDSSFGPEPVDEQVMLYSAEGSSFRNLISWLDFDAQGRPKSLFASRLHPRRS